MNRCCVSLLILSANCFAFSLPAHGQLLRRRPNRYPQRYQQTQRYQSPVVRNNNATKNVPNVAPSTPSKASQLAKEIDSPTPTTKSPVITPATEPTLSPDRELAERGPDGAGWVRRTPSPSEGLQSTTNPPSLESYVNLLPEFQDYRRPEDLQMKEVRPWPVVTPEPPRTPAVPNPLSQVATPAKSYEREDIGYLSGAFASVDVNPYLRSYNEIVQSDIEPAPLVVQAKLPFEGLDPITVATDANWFPPIFESPQFDDQIVEAAPKTDEERLEESIASVITLNNVMPIDRGIALTEVDRFVDDLYAYPTMATEFNARSLGSPPVIAALAGNERATASSSMAWTNWLWLPLMAVPVFMLVRTRSRANRQRFAQEKRAETMAASEAENTAAAKIRMAARRPRPVKVVDGALQSKAATDHLLKPSQSLLAGAGESMQPNSNEFYSPADEALLSASFDTQIDWNQSDDFTVIPGIDAHVQQMIQQSGIMSFSELATLERKSLEQLKERLDDKYSILEIVQWCQAAREFVVPPAKRVFQVEEVDFADAMVEDLASMQSMASTLRESDDLTSIDGVDDRIQTLLNSYGISRFTDLATAERSTLNAIVESESASGLTITDVIEWCRQAREMDASNLPVSQAVTNRVEVREEDFAPIPATALMDTINSVSVDVSDLVD